MGEEIEMNLVLGAGMSPEGAKAMVNAYAHELAEKIRNTPSPRVADDYSGLVDHGMDFAADLIDPEVLNSGS